jgi:hypothetical protein
MIIYVYYKFLVSEFPQVAINVRRIQSQLTAEFIGLKCSILKRPNADEEGRETWMEVYDVGDVNQNQFIDRLSELALKEGLPAPRRNEIFIPIH